MANDPDRYKPLVLDWNMGPFFVRIDASTGDVECSQLTDKKGDVILYRNVGPHFFANAKADGKIVRRATIQIVGPEVTE
jgi:hypothetical protein